MARTDSALKAAFTGKLPPDKPDYVDAWDWAVLHQHVNEGRAFHSLAKKFGTSPANVRRMATRAANLINARENLAPPDWEQRFNPRLQGHSPVIQVRPPVIKSRAEHLPPAIDYVPLKAMVSIIEKRETQDEFLVTFEFCGTPTTVSVTERQFRNLGVGFTYPLAIVATPLKEESQ